MAVSDGTMLGGVGPNSGEITAYSTFPSATFSIATVGGKTRFKADGTAGGFGNQLSLTISNGASQVPSATYRWVVGELYITGTMSVGESLLTLTFDRSSPSLDLKRDYVSSTTFKLNLEGNQSLSAFGMNTALKFRLQTDGTRIKLWVNGVLEIDAADATEINAWTVILQNNNANSIAYLSDIFAVEHSDETARPGTTVTRHTFMNPDGAGATEEFGTQADCSDGLGVYTLWDDWASGAHDSATTANVCCGGSAQTQLSTMSNPGAISDLTNTVLNIRGAGLANVAIKTVETHTRLEHGGNNIEVENLNLNTAVFFIYATAFASKPGGGSWTQAALDGLEAGIRSVNTNGANDGWTAIGAEVLSIDSDPPGLQELGVVGEGQQEPIRELVEVVAY